MVNGKIAQPPTSSNLRRDIRGGFTPESYTRRLITPMFVERVWSWSGRLEDLEPDQLDAFIQDLNERIEVEERRKQLEAHKQLTGLSSI